MDNLKCSNAFPTVSIPYVNPMQSSVVFQGFILEIENYPIDKGMMSGCQPTRHERTNDLRLEPCVFFQVG